MHVSKLYLDFLRYVSDHNQAVKEQLLQQLKLKFSDSQSLRKLKGIDCSLCSVRHVCVCLCMCLPILALATVMIKQDVCVPTCMHVCMCACVVLCIHVLSAAKIMHLLAA